MGTDIQKRKVEIKGLLEKRRGMLEQLLPPHMTAERMLATVWTEFRRTPRLLDCTPVSLVSAVLQASQAGLEIGGLRGHGYLVPYRDKKRQRTDAVFIAGYKGLLHLARQSGEISRVAAGLVFEGDLFEYEDGLRLTLRHVPSGEPPEDERLAQRVWAVVTTKDGGEYAAVMWRSQIEKIRRASAGGNSPAWQNHWGEMAKKTALRRALKLAPMGEQLERIVAADELADAGIVTIADELDDVVDIEGEPVEVEAGKARSKMQPGKRKARERDADAGPEAREEDPLQAALNVADEIAEVQS